MREGISLFVPMETKTFAAWGARFASIEGVRKAKSVGKPSIVENLEEEKECSSGKNLTKEGTVLIRFGYVNRM